MNKDYLYLEMDSLENELSNEERLNAELFYMKLDNQDQTNVKKVVKAVASLAEEYFSFGEQHNNSWAFCTDEKTGTPFFAVYLIGGYLNKKGERPDIDLLVATNMRWTSGFTDYDKFSDYSRCDLLISCDPFLKELAGEFAEGYSMQKHGELPDDYNIGATKGKLLITITPDEGKKLDVNYVRSWRDKKYRFIDEEHFYRMDAGESGEPLQRLALYRSTSDVALPRLTW